MNEMSNNSNESARPWLSVVIPIYNAEKYLKKCLDAIRKQTFSDYEVILVDDGSTDRSYDICLEYVQIDSRFRLLRKENGGSFQARIFGSEKALGEYIIFCDADDYYDNSQVFQRLFNIIDENRPEVVQFGFRKKYNHLSKKHPIVESKLFVEGDEFKNREYPKLLCSFWNESHLSMSVWNKVYSRKLLNRLPESEDVPRVFWGDDLITNLYLLEECSSICFVPDILYCYRQSSGGTSRFSLDTMRDLDSIKGYQTAFLERYCGGKKRIIESVLYSEIAEWFYHYVKEAKQHVDDTTLKKLIEESLTLPRFQMAREYYLGNEIDTAAVNSLRKADVDEYINIAGKVSNKAQLKEKLIMILKRIYSSI